MLIKAKKYVPRKKRILDIPLFNDRGMITRDIGFELQFGFRDTLDIIEYKESEVLDVRPIPKNNQYIDY